MTEPGVGSNRYSYAVGDPVNGVDPGGHQEVGAWLEHTFVTIFSCSATGTMQQATTNASEVGGSLSGLGTYENPSAAPMGIEWVSGTGPNEREFEDGMRFTESLRGSESMQTLRQALNDKYEGKVPEDGALMTDVRARFDIELLTDMTAAGQFLGSIKATTISTKVGIVTYNIVNESGTKSIFYGAITSKLGADFHVGNPPRK